MEILRLAESPDLAHSKKLLCVGFFGYMISLFCLFVPFIGFIAPFAMLAFVVIGLVGLYRFSKLAHTFVFRYYVYSILLNIGYYVALNVLLYGFIGVGDVMMLRTRVYVISGICVFGGIVVIALQLWWLYKMSVEMSFLTGIKAFVVASKFYIAAFVGFVLVGVVFGLMFVDFINNSPFLVSAAAFSGGEYLVLKFFEHTSSEWIILLCVFLCCVALASVVFLGIGLYGIEQTQVRSQG